MQNVMKRMLETCKKTTELIDKQLLTSLTFKEKMQLQAHKAMCKTCSAYENQSKLIDSFIGSWFGKDASKSKLEEEKKNKIIDEINKL